ncbi:PAS domain-containing protein, partial [Escherichia coli]|uniref:PAS domain-containing protein n=1 Tax=Escherichia coli TaxID=562 RepID=UPI003B9F1C65
SSSRAAEEADPNAPKGAAVTVLKAAIQALGSVAARNMEILLHDLDHPEHSVVAIVNGHLSGRSIGSPILAAPEQDQGFKALMQASADQQ